MVVAGVKMLPSFAFDPMITGTSFCLPARKIVATSCGNIHPSTAADVWKPLRRLTVSAGSARSTRNDKAPAASANALPAASASSSVRVIANCPPLSPIAR